MQLHLAFSSQAQQASELTRLMTANSDDQTFRQALGFVVNSVPAEWIAQDARQPLQHMLMTAKPDFIKPADASPFVWLNAYAKASVTSDADKDEFILNYIRHENDVSARTGYLSTLPKALFARIPAADRQRYKADLQRQFTAAMPSSNSEKARVLHALSRFMKE